MGHPHAPRARFGAERALRRASTGSVSRNWSPAGLGRQPLLASWVWLAVQSTGCSKKRAAAVQGGDVRNGAERHDKLAARPLWNLSTHVAELETRACTGYALPASWTSEIALSRHFCSPDAVEAYEAVRWPKGGVEGGDE